MRALPKWHCQCSGKEHCQCSVKSPPANAGDIRETLVQSLNWKDLEESIATHSSILAWRILQTDEPGRLESTGLRRVRQNWRDLACTIPFWVPILPLWRRKCQPSPVFLPGKSHGRRSLVGYRPVGCKELDATEWLHFHFLPL